MTEFLYKLYDFIFQHSKFNNEIIYFDFETTGLNPYHLKIIEYAFICEKSGEYIHSLINPKIKFDSKITEITGIHPDNLNDKPTIETKFNEIVNFINYVEFPEKKEVYLIAHNCDGFDKIILETLCKNQNKKYNWKYIDTLLLAKKLLPKVNSYSQKNLAIYFKIKPSNHRALDDTKTLKQIYHKLIEICSHNMSVSKDFLIDNPNIIYQYLY